ncbi:DNA methyltransferase [Bifidobacterium pseudolongum subsp. globosum]|uniref:DNA methyltransferase n=1 Tax=Bifidobacterium pseudolongum subsp. globosum TaxID=1690 RepID=A0A2N3QIZ8_9BIFI|nr:DNA methyltransferase [Bifidobacterium pseudolongum]PKU91457.1 DNA methyltransferase [Bifidobacterium pseudolongum subsp. globosum]
MLKGFLLDDHDGLGPYRLVPVDGPGGAKKGNPYYSFLGVSGYWRYSERKMKEKYDRGLIVKKGEGLYQKYYQSEAKESRRTATTWWDDAGLISSATASLKKLMNGSTFDTPKPVELILRILQLMTDDDNTALVLDFFSGSATTAEAVMRMNKRDNGGRKSILVQLPEKIDSRHEAVKTGYTNICAIGEERIRRAGEAIKHEIESVSNQGVLDEQLYERPNAVPDTGFRVLRIDSSSYEDVRKTPDAYTQGDLEFDVDTTKDDRTSLDLLFECLPTFQIPYSASIELLDDEAFDGYIVYSVNHGQLIACFDEKIPERVMRGMAQLDPKPSYAVVGEHSLQDSSARTNFAEFFRQSADALQGQTQIRIL